MCVCILALVIRHVKCIFSAWYRHMWPVWLYHFLPHYLINSTIFGGKIIEHIMSLIFVDPCIITQLINKTTNVMQLGAIVFIILLG